MSQLLINDYLKQLDLIKKIGGSSRETIVREAFKDLLKAWGKQHNLVFLAEYPLKTTTKSNIAVDGALLHELRMPLGYWEAKDEGDDLEEEITKKFRKGYPQDNIIFSDDVTAVLWQNRNEVLRCDMTDTHALARLLKLFFSFERPEIAGFRAAVEQFKTDLPAVLQALREMIEHEHKSNASFRKAEHKFLAHAQEVINPSLTDADVREMLIQHILTEEIFAKVFDDSDFHQHNNVARELYALEAEFFTGSLKKQTLKGLETYYAAIRAAAAQISSHHEKQTFLKVIYENFYKVYNTKAADRLGVVYTPNEIVRFMIDGADWLTEKHFGKNLIDKDVEILDPATGTGTFICELLEHFRGQPAKLKYKYHEELHANEVAILPYYVANLNIEATYAAITGNYEEFPNLCFVDTLDNVGLHTSATGTTADLFGSVSEENVARIKRQNSKRISVIIGNPPYNANQANENENNKNREYPEIDKRIKHTYIAESTAQKTKLYDMYARFFRWASDRLSENGVIALVSNSSFIDSRTFDGFRKVLTQEFNEVWVVDLKGNARTSGERRRQEGGNIFDDQIRVGVAIWFCVKKKGVHGCKIMYEAVRDYAKADEKLDFMSSKPLRERQFHLIQPDAKNNWINLADNDFDSLLPLANKGTKAAKTAAKERAIFKLYSLGVSTNRDDWLTDFNDNSLAEKMKWFVDRYDQPRAKNSGFETDIKWSRNLKRRFDAGLMERSTTQLVRSSMYRPFTRLYLYDSDLFVDELGLSRTFFPMDQENKAICVSFSKDYRVSASSKPYDLHFVGDTQGVALFRYDKAGNRTDNITDWALKQFRQHYGTPLARKRERGGGEGLSPRPPAKLPDDLRQYAREMRSHATDAEALMWQLLRDHRLANAKFRRQHPMGRYILDFYCAEQSLCIELDGGQHAEQQARDAVRDEWLQAQGIRVLRFWNNQVLAETEAVMESIYSVLTNPNAPSPQPSPLAPLPLAGEGNNGIAPLVGEGNVVVPPAGEGDQSAITKEAIFHYCYAVLHDPLYREKYALNLKREFPRIPFYADFWHWAAWGKVLMALHIDYETVAPYKLQRIDIPDEKTRASGMSPKAMLRADHSAGSITLDSETTLRGIPPEAWDYKLGNRCALEWVLDQYKEKKPKDPTIREKFDTYRFADYKEKVIDLLARVTTVSVETVRITEAMKQVAR